jgi:hypothetical protein
MALYSMEDEMQDEKSGISGGITSTLSPLNAGVAAVADNTTIYETSTYRPNDAFAEGFYDALGRVTVAFGRLDYVIMLVLKALRRTIEARTGQRRGFDELLAQDYRKSFADKIDLAKELFAEATAGIPQFGDLVLEEWTVVAFDQTLSDAKAIWDPGRNDNVHSYWTAVTRPDATPMRLRPKPIDVKAGTMDWNRSAEVPVSELLSIARDVEGLAQRLGGIIASLARKKQP